MNGKSGDRTDVPINFRFLQMLLQIADDPEIGLGGLFTRSESRTRKQDAQVTSPCFARRRSGAWHPSSILLDYLEGSTDLKTSVWRRNYSTLQPLEQQVLDVMHDQATRGQVLVLSETEAKLRYPDLVISVAWCPAEKRNLGGKITARVLFDGTHGLSVNSRTRIRDQEQAPIAADLKRTMRERGEG